MGKKDNTWLPSVDPSQAWYEGWGQLARMRSIFASVLTEFGVSIGVFIWSKNHAYAISVAMIAIATGIGLWLFRTLLLKTVSAGARLHEICHFIRDESGAILQSTAADEQAKYRERYRNFHPQAANRVAGYFRALCNEPSVCCAIRLADTSNGKHEYRTVGRSSGMDPSREELSEPVASTEGLCDVVRKNGQRGVLFIRDIPTAIKQNWWKACKTDELPDVKTLLIAPINGYIGGKKSMLGMIYVTSTRDVFRLTHAEPLKALADLLGAVYPVITGRLVKET